MKYDGFYLWNLWDHIYAWLWYEPDIVEHKEQNNIPNNSKDDSSLPFFEQNQLFGRYHNIIRTCLKKEKVEIFWWANSTQMYGIALSEQGLV